MLVSEHVSALAHRVRQRADIPDFLRDTFVQCLLNTLETTTQLLDDDTTFVFTGDIPAMWLRDSSAQVTPYLHFVKDDPLLQRLFRGLIRRQAGYLIIDPYANAFNCTPDGQGHTTDVPKPSAWVWERKFELDSLCYPIQTWHAYYAATGDRTIFDAEVHEALRIVVRVMQTEQHHDQRSEYVFERGDPLKPTDTLVFGGKGTRSNMTGMVWSAFRPSDDACTFPYLIPANMFAVVALRHVVEIAHTIYHDAALAQAAHQLCQEITYGIETYGKVRHHRYGTIYAYETDGYGNHLLMDDANVPSLLSIPYIGYRPTSDPVYQATRQFALSGDNPFYYAGTFTQGIGSPHTDEGYVWPIALIMQALTSEHRSEQEMLLNMLLTTTAGTGLMHESFHPDDPSRFTRAWFAWANSLFAEFIIRQFNLSI